MIKPPYFIGLLLAFLPLISNVNAGVIFTVSDATFISDGVSETTGTIPVELILTPEADALLGNTVLSWDLESLAVTTLTGTISGVTFESFDNGDLFENFASTLFETTTSPYTLAGNAAMALTPPLEPLLRNDVTFFLIHFSVPAAETGSFNVVLNGADGLGQFGVFNSSTPNGYSNVFVANGTITITSVPEPASISILCALACSLLLNLRQKRN